MENVYGWSREKNYYLKLSKLAINLLWNFNLIPNNCRHHKRKEELWIFTILNAKTKGNYYAKNVGNNYVSIRTRKIIQEFGNTITIIDWHMLAVFNIPIYEYHFEWNVILISQWHNDESNDRSLEFWVRTWKGARQRNIEHPLCDSIVLRRSL